MRDPPSQHYAAPTNILSPDEELLLRVVPRHENRLKQSTYHLGLWKGMPVIVMDKHNKGMGGEIRDVHERYKPEPPKLDRQSDGVSSVPHQCSATCKSCRDCRPTGHVCSIRCERCRLAKLPKAEENPTLGTLVDVTLDIYVWPKSSIEKCDVLDIRPAE